MSRIGVVLTALVIICTLVAAGGAVAQSRATATVRLDYAATRNVELIVDGKIVETEAIEDLGGMQIMVWLRDLQDLGWGKASSGQPGEFLFDNGKGVMLSFTKNQGVAKINSLAVRLPVDTYMKNGKLMVPLSFVAKALGYSYTASKKTIATISTKPSKTTEKASNSIHGKVTYAGKGIAGIVVRAVDREFNPVKGAKTVTQNDGSYKIIGLPDGVFMAYVYVADNPLYFNRASEAVGVSGGDNIALKTIAIGRILAPIAPRCDAKLIPVDGKVEFKWEACPGAANYELLITKQGSDAQVLRAACKTNGAKISVYGLKPGEKYEAGVTALDSAGDYLGGTIGVGGKPWGFTMASSGKKK